MTGQQTTGRWQLQNMWIEKIIGENVADPERPF